MLSLLHIENIALIESVDISFQVGLNVLTGETGAGKSIVLDAISALMGERTSRDLIRTGERSALVSGLFRNLPTLPWFGEMGIEPDENGELLVTRQIMADGKNLCRVGGLPCTVVQLRLLGRQLINIHGQHDSQQLLDDESHLAYLDSFGGLGPQLEEYQQTYGQMTQIRREMDALHMDEGEKSRRMDTLRFQISELERAGLMLGEDETLVERRDLLRNSGKLVDAAEEAYQALFGDENRAGAVDLLGEAEGAMTTVSRLAGEMATMADALAELRYSAQDLAENLRDLRDRFDASPGELDQVETRLDMLYRLKKKYGGTTEEMLRYLERCREELDSIELSGDKLARLEQQYEKTLAQAMGRAATLSEARRCAAEAMREKIQEELRQLDMPKVRFQVEFEPKNGEPPLDQTGMDKISFFMSANVGEELKPIHKVASGGELARIMLALKNVLTENDTVSTMIFDEVDAGVSGRAAQKVAEKMGALGTKRQVLCVTHLPQIAAMADLHFLVQKGERDGRTYTEVAALSREDRREELARLTGGVHVTEAIRQGAEELLAQAEALKKGMYQA